MPARRLSRKASLACVRGMIVMSGKAFLAAVMAGWWCSSVAMKMGHLQWGA